MHGQSRVRARSALHLNGCVECGEDSHCGVGRLCDSDGDRYQCIDCRVDSDCRSRAICQDNSCVAVDCTLDSHCSQGRVCDTATNSCVCPPGQTWVQAPGLRICGACVRGPRDCEGLGDCSLSQVCAQRYCINRCDGRRDLVRLRREIEGLKELLVGPPRLKNSPLEFSLADLRKSLEQAKVGEPVTIRIYNPKRQLVVDLGTYTPTKGSFTQMQSGTIAIPKIAIGPTGGCGFRLQISTGGDQLSETEVCLRVR